MTSLLENLSFSAEAPLSSDAMLDRFVSWVSASGLSLYSAQEEAILELLSGKHVVLATPTGSGKSMVALAFHFQALGRGQRSFYTCPIKALVNEKFFALCDVFGPERVGLMTGDATVNRDAPIICCTAEILSNLSIREHRQFVDCVVMDEFHFYGDKDRGVAWQVPLLTLESTQFLLMSATLGDVDSICDDLKERTNREVAVIRSAQRPVPLEFLYAETPLHETIAELLAKNRAPIYLVNFTQRSASEQAQNLLSIDLCTKPEKERLKELLIDQRFDTPYGKDLKRLLLHGVGVHHAGLLPKYRRLVERLSQQGVLKVISGTDTLGVGVNVPIRTVLFTQLCKFDGEKTGILSVRDFQQISGRAGRKGFDENGWVVAQAPAHIIENARLMQKRAEGKKNVTLQKPPTKGFAHWDHTTFQRLQASLPEKLESRFSVTHALLVNLLQAYAQSSTNGYRALVSLIMRSHTHQGGKVRLLKSARLLFRALLTAEIVHVRKKTATMPAHAEVDPNLQPDFSLNHTLSLYLFEALDLLDAEKEQPTWPLDVLSLVESILENPDTVLFAQRDALKTEKMQELKAKGVEYDERINELEKVDYPKPLAELIYNSFNSFAAKHPWIGAENIRPKSVAREIVERAFSFNDFIRELGLQRSEGLVLRYLSEAYKTLTQNVPESTRNEALEDIAGYLLATIRHTDSSLVDEWQALRAPEVRGAPSRTEIPKPPRPDLAKHPKALAARVRAEMHQLIRYFANRNYEGAAEHVAANEAFGAKEFEKALQPFWADNLSIDITPKARLPHWTQLSESQPRVFTVRHSIVDTNGDHDWYIEGVVDLSDRPDVDGALVQVRHVGR